MNNTILSVVNILGNDSENVMKYMYEQKVFPGLLILNSENRENMENTKKEILGIFGQANYRALPIDMGENKVCFYNNYIEIEDTKIMNVKDDLFNIGKYALIKLKIGGKDVTLSICDYNKRIDKTIPTLHSQFEMLGMGDDRDRLLFVGEFGFNCEENVRAFNKTCRKEGYESLFKNKRNWDGNDYYNNRCNMYYRNLDLFKYECNEGKGYYVGKFFIR